MGNHNRARKVWTKVVGVPCFRIKLPRTVVDVEIPPYHVVGSEIPLCRGVMRTDALHPRARLYGNNRGTINGIENGRTFFLSPT